MLWITDQITIEDWEITESFIRASGPGGQNVNKVATAVELRFEAARSPNLPEPVKARLRRLAGRRWTITRPIMMFSCDSTFLHNIYHNSIVEEFPFHFIPKANPRSLQALT